MCPLGIWVLVPSVSSLDRGRSQQVAIVATCVLQKRSLPLLLTTPYDLALPRSLIPPRKPWTECARHRVLVILVAFSLISFRPAYSFPSSSRHSSRVPRPRIAFSLLFILSPSAPIRCPIRPPDRPLGLPTLVFTLRPHFIDFARSSYTRSPDLPD